MRQINTHTKCDYDKFVVQAITHKHNRGRKKQNWRKKEKKKENEELKSLKKESLKERVAKAVQFRPIKRKTYKPS